MKLTKSYLKQLIKEEIDLSKAFNNDPGAPFDNMVGVPVSDTGWKRCILDPGCLERTIARIEDLAVAAAKTLPPVKQKAQEDPPGSSAASTSDDDDDGDDDISAEIAYLKNMIQKQEKRGKGDSAVVAALKAKLKQKIAKV